MFVEAATLKVLHELEVKMSLIRGIDRVWLGTMALVWFAINIDFMYYRGSFYLPTITGQLEGKAHEDEEQERRLLERTLSGRVETTTAAQQFHAAAERYEQKATSPNAHQLRLRSSSRVEPAEQGPESSTSGMCEGKGEGQR